jgi:hypothetical protein
MAAPESRRSDTDAYPLPRLIDGELSVGALRRWGGEFDALSGGEKYPAQAFVEWLDVNLAHRSSTDRSGSD